jgi:ribose transport system substrate-binding protein
MTAPAQTPSKPASSHKLATFLIIIILILGGALCWQAGVFGQSNPKVALVTSGDTPYWDRVIEGAQDAAKQYDVDLTVIRVKTDPAAQTQAVEDLLKDKWDGIAISPVSPNSQANLLASVAGATTLLTFDSDMPIARRLCFVGTDNYSAGRSVGDLVKSAIPDGGEVILSVGNPDKDNTQRRRQGCIDELLDRATEPMRPADPIDQPLTAQGSKYTISTTLVDGADPAKCTDLATQAMKDHPNVKCFVGLVGYSAPALVKAVQAAGKTSQIKVVGFDVNDDTLADVEAGTVYGTMMQDQYGCGFHAVRILGENARHRFGGLPLFQTHTLGCAAVTKDNVADTRSRLANKQPMAAPSVSAPGGSTTQPTT